MFTMIPFQRNPWSILDELESLQASMNRTFSDWTPGTSAVHRQRSYPPVNVWSSENGVAVEAEMPGVDPKDVDISVEADQLTIRGSINKDEGKDGVTYHRRERATGEFARTLQLPFRADAGGVKANYKNGLLQIAIPRSEKDKPFKVAIEAD